MARKRNKKRKGKKSHRPQVTQSFTQVPPSNRARFGQKLMRTHVSIAKSGLTLFGGFQQVIGGRFSPSGASQFNLGLFTDATTYAALYDQYRFTKAEFHITSPVNQPGRAFIVYDPDGGDFTGVTMDKMLAYSSCKIFDLVPNKPTCIVSCVPGSIVDKTAKFKQWYDLADSAVNHYCFGFGWWDGNTSTTNLQVPTIVKVWVEFRGKR